MHFVGTAFAELLVSGQKYKLLNPSTPTTGERNKYITNRPENKIVYCLKKCEGFRLRDLLPLCPTLSEGLALIAARDMMIPIILQKPFRSSLVQHMLNGTGYHKKSEADKK